VANPRSPSWLALYTMFPLPILCGIYCNDGVSGGNIVLRNSVCDEVGKWGAQTKVVFVKNIIDSCTYASKQNIIL